MRPWNKAAWVRVDVCEGEPRFCSFQLFSLGQAAHLPWGLMSACEQLLSSPCGAVGRVLARVEEGGARLTTHLADRQVCAHGLCAARAQRPVMS